jgi:hypothetical protein
LCLVEHAQRCILEVDEIIFELVALEVLHHVLCEFRVLELGDGNGTIGCNHQLLEDSIELEEILEFGLLSSIVKILDQECLLTPLAKISILLQEIKVDVALLYHPFLRLLDHFGLSKCHFGCKAIRQ